MTDGPLYSNFDMCDVSYHGFLNDRVLDLLEAAKRDAREAGEPRAATFGELVALVEELLAGHDAEEGKPSSRFDGVDPEAALDALGAVRAG
ncbi:MAG: hypothetical protein AAFR28_13295, partial [Pseudomonadota bacterium]